MDDVQIGIWQRRIAEIRRTILRFAYAETVHDEARDEIARLERAIAERRNWLTQEAILAELQAMPMPAYDDLYAFLKRQYKHERFEGRNGEPGWADYSHVVTRGRMADLEARGWDLISHHESASGTMIVFDRSLTPRPAPWHTRAEAV